MADGRLFAARQQQVAARVRSLLDGFEAGPSGADPDDAADAPAGFEVGGATRRNAIVVACAVVVAAVLTGAWVLSSRPHVDPLHSGPSPAARSSTAIPSTVAVAPQPRSTAAAIVVDVAGKVRHPGLYRLPTGSRIDDALRAAGGTMPGVNEATVNRAARISDGQQIVVGLPVAAVPASGSGSVGGGASTPAGPININSASSAELQTLPGVGPVLAQHILDWRTQHGSFASVDQLQSVSGIGPAKFAAMRAWVVV